MAQAQAKTAQVMAMPMVMAPETVTAMVQAAATVMAMAPAMFPAQVMAMPTASMLSLSWPGKCQHHQETHLRNAGEPLSSSSASKGQ